MDHQVPWIEPSPTDYHCDAPACNTRIIANCDHCDHSFCSRHIERITCRKCMDSVGPPLDVYACGGNGLVGVCIVCTIPSRVCVCEWLPMFVVDGFTVEFVRFCNTRRGVMCVDPNHPKCRRFDQRLARTLFKSPHFSVDVATIIMSFM